MSFIFGSGRFGGVFINNVNDAVVGDYDVPTKLVDADKNVRICLPAHVERWGLYPTHQESWLALPFVVACHASHSDEAGLALRREAWEAIPASQWPALAAKAAEFAAEFRQRLEAGDLCERKLYKSLTRALQDCVLYLVGRESFPTNQDAFLAASPVAALIQQANKGRAGELSPAEGLQLADKVDSLVERLVGEFGGIEVCRSALETLQQYVKPSRVIVLPEGVNLDRGAQLVRCDIIIGVPDAHDLDTVSIVEGEGAPELVQLHNVLSGQRLDIMAVSPDLAAGDHLTGGHPAFQSVAEMLLANGTPRTHRGTALVARLAGAVDPKNLAAKYRRIAQDFWAGDHRKSWRSRGGNPNVTPVKQVIPLYRIACDLLPRAAHMERTGTFPGDGNIAAMAQEAGLGEAFRSIRAVLDRQDATQEELQAIAACIVPHISVLEIVAA